MILSVDWLGFFQVRIPRDFGVAAGSRHRRHPSEPGNPSKSRTFFVGGEVVQAQLRAAYAP